MLEFREEAGGTPALQQALTGLFRRPAARRGREPEKRKSRAFPPGSTPFLFVRRAWVRRP